MKQRGSFFFLICIQALRAYAADPISIENASIQKLDILQTVSGASGLGFQYVVVNDDNDHQIYTLEETGTQTRSFRNLSEYNGFYSYISSLPKKRLSFTDISHCPSKDRNESNSFHLIDRNGDHILEVNDQSRSLIRREIQVDGYESYFVETSSSQKIAIDCKNEVLYLTRESHPNTVFKAVKTPGYDYQWKIEDHWDFNNGDDPNEEAITDLQFKKGLYILQKNQAGLTIISEETGLFQSYIFEDARKLYQPNQVEYTQSGLEDSLAVTRADKVRFFVNPNTELNQNDSLAIDINLPLALAE